jgi:NTE family protein
MVTKAIVLGAGGPTGVAWEVGLLAGLAEAGLDVTAADLVVGTSAGSLVGAFVTSGANIEELYENQLETSGPASAQPPKPPPTTPPAATMAAGVVDPAASAAASGASRGAVLTLAWLVLRYRDPARYRREVGKLALGARTMTEAQWRSNFEGRLPTEDWPKAGCRRRTGPVKSC